MDTQQVIDIIKATGGTVSELISQAAFFFAIQQASKWLSISLPLLILFSVLLKIAKTNKVSGMSDEKVGIYVLVAWLAFAGTLFTGVRGVAHLIQAAVSPAIYVAATATDVHQLIQELKK